MGPDVESREVSLDFSIRPVFLTGSVLEVSENTHSYTHTSTHTRAHMDAQK